MFAGCGLKWFKMVGKGWKRFEKVGKVPKSMGKYEEVFSRFPKCTEKEGAFRLLFTKRVNFRNCVKEVESFADCVSKSTQKCSLRLVAYPKGLERFRLTLKKSVAFETMLQKKNRLQIPKLVRWQCKRKPLRS